MPVADWIFLADAFPGDAYASLTVDLSVENWIEFWIYVSQDELDQDVSAAVTTSGDYCEFGMDGLVVMYEAGDWFWATDVMATTSDYAVDGDAWHNVLIYYDGAGNITWTIDGNVLYGAAYSVNPGDLTGEFHLGNENSHPSEDERYFNDVSIGTTLGGVELFFDDFDTGDFSAWDSTTGGCTVVRDFTGGHEDPQPDTGPPQIYIEPYWRFLITNLNLEVLTWLETISRNRRLEFTLNAPAMATGSVPSDNPEVNIDISGHPYVDEGRRCLIGLRREGEEDAPWKVRFAGIIELVEDSVDENSQPTGETNYTAWDPWKLLYSRPIRKQDGSLPGPAGVHFNTRVSTIITRLLARTQFYEGETYTFVGGIQPTDVIEHTFQQGTSVGEAFQELCEAGYCDLLFQPYFNPSNRPKKLARLSIYSLLGSLKHNPVFAWDRPGRTLGGLTRQIDGTQRANKIQFYLAQGGPSVGLESDFASVAAYGEYWLQQFQPGNSGLAVEALAQEQLIVRKNGVQTFTARPLPEVGARPFIDYRLGDQVPVLVSSNLRKRQTLNAAGTAPQIAVIPIVIDDNGTERVDPITFVDKTSL